MTFLFRRAIHFVRKTMPPPDRWEVYRPMGSVIPGTKFLAFKVPLKEELLKQVEEKDRFSPAILMKLLGDQGLKLGAVIDLTFTFKYYNIDEFVRNSVEHKKIFTPGHSVPSESVFQQFAHAVKKFDTGDNDHVIGVHCTHGVNRTGYLICRYMIEEMSYEPEAAISLFDEARGHKLERENYLEDLKTRKCGQSTYDPNFKVPDEEIRRGGHQGPRKEKPRWRHRREDHPEWRREDHSESRRKYHDSAEMRGMRVVQGSYTLPLDRLRFPYPEDSGFIQHGNGSAYNSFSQGTDYPGVVPVRPMPGQNLEEGGLSVPDYFNPGGSVNGYPIHRSIQDYPHRYGNSTDRNDYNPHRTGRGKRRSYCGHRFDPIYSYRAPGANRDKDDERQNHRNDDSVNPEINDTKS